MKSAFDKIAAGLEDAIAYSRGDTTRGRVATVDVTRVRAAASNTQAQFAARYRLPIGTLRDWEQGRRQPDTGSRVYLQMIEADPEGVARILEKVPA